MGEEEAKEKDRTDRKKDSWLTLSSEDFRELGLQPPGLEKALNLETLFPAQ